MFIMDSMGTMLKLIERLEIFSTHLKDRLVILDPTDVRPPAWSAAWKIDPVAG